MFGVLAWGWPPRWPTQSFRSSMVIRSTFGRSAAFATPDSAKHAAPTINQRAARPAYHRELAAEHSLRTSPRDRRCSRIILNDANQAFRMTRRPDGQTHRDTEP